MNTSSPAVTSYLKRLESALAQAPADLRTEIVAGVREELDGLESDAAAERIRELGDPATIAAEALEGVPAEAVAAKPSSVYLGFTLALLVVGGYLLPVVGWLLGLALVIASPVWSRREKRITVGGSLAAAVAALALLFLLRGPDLGTLGLVLFVGVPFVANLALAYYISSRWTSAARGNA